MDDLSVGRNIVYIKENKIYSFAVPHVNNFLFPDYYLTMILLLQQITWASNNSDVYL